MVFFVLGRLNYFPFLLNWLFLLIFYFVSFVFLFAIVIDIFLSRACCVIILICINFCVSVLLFFICCWGWDVGGKWNVEGDFCDLNKKVNINSAIKQIQEDDYQIIQVRRTSVPSVQRSLFCL